MRITSTFAEGSQALEQQRHLRCLFQPVVGPMWQKIKRLAITFDIIVLM